MVGSQILRVAALPIKSELEGVNLFDKFASHLLEHCIFHIGIIRSLVLVTCSVLNSFFLKQTLVQRRYPYLDEPGHVIRV